MGRKIDVSTSGIAVDRMGRLEDRLRDKFWMLPGCFTRLARRLFSKSSRTNPELHGNSQTACPRAAADTSARLPVGFLPYTVYLLGNSHVHRVGGAFANHLLTYHPPTHDLTNTFCSGGTQPTSTEGNARRCLSVPQILIPMTSNDHRDIFG